MGFFLFGYVIPLILYYDYPTAIKEVGIFKVYWAKSLVVVYSLLYVLNMFWFSKLIQGYKKYVKA